MPSDVLECDFTAFKFQGISIRQAMNIYEFQPAEWLNPLKSLHCSDLIPGIAMYNYAGIVLKTAKIMHNYTENV